MDSNAGNNLSFFAQPFIVSADYKVEQNPLSQTNQQTNTQNEIKDTAGTTLPGGKYTKPPVAYTGVQGSIEKFLCSPSYTSADDLSKCVNKLYRFGAAVAAFAAVGFIALAGYMYMLAGEKGKEKGKDYIKTSIAGLVLIFSAYALLYSINPDIVKFKSIQPPQLLNVAALPSCEDIGFEDDCELAVAQPGSDIDLGSYTGSYTACGRVMTDYKAEKDKIKTIQVKVWDIVNGQKETKTLNAQVHECIEVRVKQAFDDYYKESDKFPINELGGYNPRLIAGTNKISGHSFGLTLDINASVNCHANNNGECKDKNYSYKSCPGSDCSPYSITTNSGLYKAMTKNGLAWGGQWKSSKDYMHFTCAKEERGNCPIIPKTDKKDNTIAEYRGPVDKDFMKDQTGLDYALNDESPDPYQLDSDCNSTTAKLEFHSKYSLINKFINVLPGLLSKNVLASCSESENWSESEFNSLCPSGEYKTEAALKKANLLRDVTFPVWGAQGTAINGPWINTNVTIHSTTGYITLHKCVADDFLSAMQEIYSIDGPNKPDNERFTFSSIVGFNWKNTSRGKISFHSYGVALDVNNASNCRYVNGVCDGTGLIYAPCDPAYNQPKYRLNGTGCNYESILPNGHVVQIFKKYGFGWGGNWRNDKDYMHFSQAKGEQGSKPFHR